MAKRKGLSKDDKEIVDLYLSTGESDNDSPLNYKFDLKCKNKKQKEAYKTINDNEISIICGASGTGKSYVALGRAIELLKQREYKQILIVTPLVEVGGKSTMGFLPGDEYQKLFSWSASSIYTISKMIGKSTVDKLIDIEKIQLTALAFLRGRSIDNSIVILEEGQNCSFEELKTFCTRIGSNSKFIITADLEQTDRKFKDNYIPLKDLSEKIKGVEGVGVYEFIVENPDDILRNPLIGRILEKLNEKDAK